MSNFRQELIRELDFLGIGIAEDGTITFNDAYSFPTTDGTNGQTFETDGAGTLTFQTPSGGGGGGSAGILDGGTRTVGVGINDGGLRV